MNSTVTQFKPATDFSDIESRVLKHFDLGRPEVRAAVKAWRDDLAQIHATWAGANMVHEIEAPEVIENIIEYHVADIEVQIAIQLAKVKQKKHQLKLQQVQTAVLEFEGVSIDGENHERLIPEILGIVHQPPTSAADMVRACVDAANAKPDDRQKVVAAGPLSQCETGFAEDFLDVLTRQVDKVREVVNNLVQDPEFAEKVAGDKSVISPIRYLAQLVLKANESAQLPTPPSPRQYH